MKFSSVVCTALLTVPLLAVAGSPIQQPLNWLESLTPSIEVTKEISKYPGLNSAYADELPNAIRKQISQQAKAVIESAIKTGTCTPGDTVTFGSPSAAAANDSVAKEFEASMVHVETIYCLPGIQTQYVAKTFLTPYYQKNAFPEVVESIHTGNKVCQKTSAFGVGKGDLCYTNSTLESDGNYFLHSYVDYNGPQSTAPTYFREFFTAFIRLPNATMYYGNIYARGIKIGGMLKSIAKMKIENGNGKALSDLLDQSTKLQAGAPK